MTNGILGSQKTILHQGLGRRQIHARQNPLFSQNLGKPGLFSSALGPFSTSVHAVGAAAEEPSAAFIEDGLGPRLLMAVELGVAIQAPIPPRLAWITSGSISLAAAEGDRARVRSRPGVSQDQCGGFISVSQSREQGMSARAEIPLVCRSTASSPAPVLRLDLAEGASRPRCVGGPLVRGGYHDVAQPPPADVPGIEQPLVQAPMVGMARSGFAAAACEAGSLGARGSRDAGSFLTTCGVPGQSASTNVGGGASPVPDSRRVDRWVYQAMLKSPADTTALFSRTAISVRPPDWLPLES